MERSPKGFVYKLVLAISVAIALCITLHTARMHRATLADATASGSGSTKFYGYSKSSIEELKHVHKPSTEVILDSGDPVLLSINAVSLKELDQIVSAEFVEAQKKKAWISLTAQNAAESRQGNKFSTFSKLYEKDLNEIPFSQGLVFSGEGKMIESAGQYMGSLLREFDVTTGKTLRYTRLPDGLFAEGCALVKIEDGTINTYEKGGTHAPTFNGLPSFAAEAHATTSGRMFILQLTWRENLLIVYDYLNFMPVLSFNVPFVGWGLTSNLDLNCHLGGKLNNCQSLTADETSATTLRLWATSGSDILYELDGLQVEEALKAYIRNEKPGFAKDQSEPLRVLRSTQMSCLGTALKLVNELEFDPIRYSIYANIFYRFIVVEIHPDTGICKSVISFGGLYDPTTHDHDVRNDVMNGIAIQWSKNGRYSANDLPAFYVTGKRWPHLYIATLKDVTPLKKILSWNDFKTAIPGFLSNGGVADDERRRVF